MHFITPTRMIPSPVEKGSGFFTGPGTTSRKNNISYENRNNRYSNKWFTETTKNGTYEVKTSADECMNTIRKRNRKSSSGGKRDGQIQSRCVMTQ